MNNLEASDSSWQERSEDEGITVIASQAPPLEIPHPPMGQTGGVGVSTGHAG